MIVHQPSQFMVAYLNPTVYSYAFITVTPGRMVRKNGSSQLILSFYFLTNIPFKYNMQMLVETKRELL